jgi:tetratricopeptide (TPR) repeat protein
VIDHPGPKLLRKFALGDLSPGEADAVVVHLRRGCASCQAEVASHLRPLLVTAAHAAEVSREPLDAYDRAIDAALASIRLHRAAAVKVRLRTRETLAKLRAGGWPALLADLDGTPPATPPRLARPSGATKSPGPDRTRSPGGNGARSPDLVEAAPAAAAPCRPAHSPRGRLYPLFDALLTRSWELRQDDLGQTIELAGHATRLAAALGDDGYTQRQVADFQARAWSDLANACRIADQPARAEEAMAGAFEHLRQGTGDERLEARLLSLQASLLASRGGLRSSLEALFRAQAIHLRHGDRHLAGRALIQAGFNLGASGLPEPALQAVEAGLELVDAELDPDLCLVALHNRIDLLSDSGRLEEARHELRRHRTRLIEGQGVLNEARVSSVEGRIEARLGNLESAEQAFLATRRLALQAGAKRLAAMAGLDLAAVWMVRGHLGESQALIGQAVEVLVAIDAPSHVAEALLRLLPGRQLAAVTAAQVQAAADLVRRLGRGDVADGR